MKLMVLGKRNSRLIGINMTFKSLLESTTIYHGDNFTTIKLSPKLMNHGNNQEGVGIYFGSLDTAQVYGKNIISANINPKKFINSRDPIGKHFESKIKNILFELHKTNNEPLYYDMTDWGIEVQEPEEVDIFLLGELAHKLKNEQVRNFQVDMANKFGVETFVKVWNKVLPNIHGTYQDQSNDTWYAVINTKIKVEKL